MRAHRRRSRCAPGAPHLWEVEQVDQSTPKARTAAAASARELVTSLQAQNVEVYRALQDAAATLIAGLNNDVHWHRIGSPRPLEVPGAATEANIDLAASTATAQVLCVHPSTWPEEWSAGNYAAVTSSIGASVRK